MDRVTPWLEWLHQHRCLHMPFVCLESRFEAQFRALQLSRGPEARKSAPRAVQERLVELEGSQMQVLRGEQQRCSELRRQHELLEECQRGSELEL